MSKLSKMFYSLMLVMVIVGVSGIFAVKNGYFNTGNKNRYVLAGRVVSSYEYEQHVKLANDLGKYGEVTLSSDRKGPYIRINLR